MSEPTGELQNSTPSIEQSDESKGDQENAKFRLDRSKIIQSSLVDQLPLLAEFGVAAYDQDAFEAGVLEQVDDALRQSSTTTTKSKSKSFAVDQSKIPIADDDQEEKPIAIDSDRPSTSSADAFSITPSTMINPRSMILEPTSTRIKFGEAMPFDLIGKNSEKSSTIRSAIPTTSATSAISDDIGDEEEETEEGEIDAKSGSDYVPSDGEEEIDEEEEELDEDLDEDEPSTSSATKKKGRGRKRKSEVDFDKEKIRHQKSVRRSLDDLKDDGNDKHFHKRMNEWKASQLHDRLVRSAQSEAADESSHSTGFAEENIELTGGLKIPTNIWDQLYPYQKTGVRWLWDLHCQAVGGVIGDEMGLGKTIQIIAFLAALDNSKLSTFGSNSHVGLGPVLIVCPTTVMHQWVQEFHRWWPPLRVVVLHESGSYSGSRSSLVRHINQHGGVLITSYSTMTLERDSLLKYDWHYVVLDEGHKIRNPDARVTVTAKRFRTPHRLILSGTPMQNSLKELWSLFDFVFPGRLGALPVFLREFGVPITQGGYSNATEIQVRTAYRCACVLRDAISPYLLRRMKADVQQTVNLPSKNEQVLFCRLTDEQRGLYRQYLQSRQCESILKGGMQVFVGLIALRKLCNHPDLLTGGPNRLGEADETDDPSSAYGYSKRSGKLTVVEALLKLWQSQGHRVLLFSQSKQMLDILETFVRDRGYTYFRMDGGTPIGSRQTLVAKFNEDPAVFVFLLTTRVGGLGLNLIGADRVLIYDPDWNPSTDAQARERVWRIGQQRPVTIYRLLTAGTIEEKIYHRQIFKQFLTNRVLKDPRQRRFFKTNDLYELFTLADDKDEGGGTETGSLFAGVESEINKAPSKKRKHHREANIFDRLAEERGRSTKKTKSTIEISPRVNGKSQVDEEDIDFVPESAKEESRQLTEDRRQQLREMAREISRRLGIGTANGPKATVVDQKLEKPKSKRDKSTTRKDKKLDGVRIPCLDGRSDFRPAGSGVAEGESGQLDESNSRHQDDYVLRKLLKKNEIRSAIRHDRIVNDAESDYTLVEAEAETVARHASQALEASRRMITESRVGPGALTWTGRQGDVGVSGDRTTSRPRFGPKARRKPTDPVEKPAEIHAASSSTMERPLFTGLKKRASNDELSSSNLLAEIRIRQQKQLIVDEPSNDPERREGVLLPSGNGTRGHHQAATIPCPPRFEQLMNELRLFLVFGGKNADGKASTQEILAKFGNRVQSQDSIVFRSMLSRICDFERRSDGEGVWVLKPAYR